MPPAIHWFRRDLRLLDNTALFHASRDHDHVIPCYIPTTWNRFHAWTGNKRQTFLCGCLRSLAADLTTLDGQLIIRHGDPIEQLGRLVRETGATAIYFNRDPDPHGRNTEERLAAKCREWGVECRAWNDITLHTPEELLTKAGDPYRVYTPFSKLWLSLEKAPALPRPASLATPRDISSEALPRVQHWGLDRPHADLIEAGERAALKRLKIAVDDQIAAYSAVRDRPSADGTSRLSQDLRFGLLSVRTIHERLVEAKQAAHSTTAQAGFQTYLKELAWREFYMATLHHYPYVLEEEFNPVWRGLPWYEPDSRFDAWKEGRTGFPIVDAGIRELLATGFMHNRLRMITAMFLTKDLHLDWRLGESFFMQHLVDGEIASNNGGWQWSAGTGADAAPYFRIQNPWSQSKRHDPDGDYIRRWVPELSTVPSQQLHEPPVADHPIAAGYPLPCLDHKIERERTLAIFKEHKLGSER